MAFHKNIYKKKQFTVLFVLTFSLLSIYTYLITYDYSISKTKSEVTLSPLHPTYYPTQYSDTHITDNAVETNYSLAQNTFDRGSLLGTVFSSTQKEKTGTVSTEPENGTWLWTSPLTITPQYRGVILAGAQKNGIKNIYLSIDSYLDIYAMSDGPEKELKKKEFDKAIEDFIYYANLKGITVDAEGGWRNWAEPTNDYKAFAVLSYAIEFNKTHELGFRGFQYDVEPYLLDRYQTEKESVLRNYLSLVDTSLRYIGDSDLEFSVVIPEFFDGTNQETPRVSYAGKTTFTFDHLVNILNRRAGSKIILMSYRNWSEGENGSIDISRYEISRANIGRTKVIIAQETGNVEPDFVTFFSKSKTYYTEQNKLIQKAFAESESFGGVAVHYVNAYLDLKK